MAQQAGYSGTPLAKKLGIKSGFNASIIGAPDYYFSLLDDMPLSVNFNDAPTIRQDFIHLFVQEKQILLALLPILKECIKPNGIIWVSWPKQASKVITDVTEELVRNCAISIGLVDIKICAVDAVWSGLKLVIPVKDR